MGVLDQLLDKVKTGIWIILIVVNIAILVRFEPMTHNQKWLLVSHVPVLKNFTRRW